MGKQSTHFYKYGGFDQPWIGIQALENLTRMKFLPTLKVLFLYDVSQIGLVCLIGPHRHSPLGEAERIPWPSVSETTKYASFGC